jgi:uncharacterized membrane protein YeaQ/YmgE (transglycosylase-associated protein family)
MILEGGATGGLAALFGTAILLWFFWNLLGAVIVGALARYLLPGKDKVGWLTTIAIGFLGGILANIVGHLVGLIPWGRNAGFIGSVLGAMALLLAHRVWVMTKKPKKPAEPVAKG